MHQTAQISTAASLQQVVDATEKVQKHLTDTHDETPYTFKKLTYQGKAHFRFTQVVVVNGRQYEVTVRSM